MSCRVWMKRSSNDLMSFDKRPIAQSFPSSEICQHASAIVRLTHRSALGERQRRKAVPGLFDRPEIPALEAQPLGPGFRFTLVEFQGVDLMSALDDLVGRDPDLRDIVLCLPEMCIELRHPGIE